jgi:predicted nucleic acid-binding protein
VPSAVIDTSALVDVFMRRDHDTPLQRRVLTASLAAPELIDVEAANVLRRLAHQGLLPDEDAGSILTDVAQAPITRAPHRPLLARIWELRHSIRSYDAAYIALAEILDVPLITSDAKLGASHGHHAEIEVYPA